MEKRLNMLPMLIMLFTESKRRRLDLQGVNRMDFTVNNSRQVYNAALNGHETCEIWVSVEVWL